MLPGIELMNCPDLAVPGDVMQHVVRVESSFNPYAIGVVGARLARQPRNLAEAVATARMLERRGFNFSVGLAQVNRHNLARHGLGSYERAFDACANLQAGSRILAECHGRARGDWGKSFSCYYSGNFTTGYRHGYVQKIYASMRAGAAPDAAPVEVIGYPPAARCAAPGHSRLPGAAEPLAKRRVAPAPAPAASLGRAEDRPGAPVPPDARAAAPPATSSPSDAGDEAFVF